MAIGTLFGTNTESVGLYGTPIGGSVPSNVYQTYFEWFIFKENAGTPATPTGGSWNFSSNTGTPPTGWTANIATVPLNTVWISTGFVDSRNPTVITWSTPGLLSSTSVYATAYADVFTGNGTTVNWTLSTDPVTVLNMDVSINGLNQVPTTDFTIVGTTFTTTTAAPLGTVILVRYRQTLPLSFFGIALNVGFTPVGTISSTNVQAAIAEMLSDYAASSGSYLVGYLPAGTGAVATTVQEYLNRSISLNNGNPAHSDGTNTLTGSPRWFIGNNTPSSDDSALLVGRGLTGSYATGAHAYRDETTYIASGTGLLAYASFDAIAILSGAATYNHLHGFQARPDYSGSGSIAGVRNFTAQTTHNGSGAIAENIGLYVADALGAGPITLNYGIQIKPLVRGASNFAIYSEGTAQSYFGGTLQSGGAVTAAGVVSGSNITSDSGGNNASLGVNASQQVNNLYGTFVGHNAGASVPVGGVIYATAVGSNAAFNIGASSTALGAYAGALATGSGCVYLGFKAGYFETGNNKLFIDNAPRVDEADARAKALVYGVFDASTLNQRFNVNGVIMPLQAPTASAPAYVKGGIYFDTTLNKLRIGGATAWETVTSV